MDFCEALIAALASAAMTADEGDSLTSVDRIFCKLLRRPSSESDTDPDDEVAFFDADARLDAEEEDEDNGSG